MNPQELLVDTRLTRRTALKATGMGAAGFTLAQTKFLRSAAAKSDTVQDILDINATTERFGVTFLGEGLQANKDGKFDKTWPDAVVAIVTAARAQEHYHLDAFQKAGGKALVKSFTVPPEYLTSFDAFFGAVVEQETAETAAQIAAIKAFTMLGRPDLVKVSFQYAAEEAEHRVLANYTRGTRPANDHAFAPALFDTVADYLASLRKRGIIDGTGMKITYPGPGDIDDANVTDKTPGGPVASCIGDGASATPTS